MAFNPINDDEIAVGKALVKNIFQKTKDNFDTIYSELNSVLVGVSKVEVFNAPVVLGNTYSSLTGLSYYRAPNNISLNACLITLFETNDITTGNLEVDIRKNSSYDPDGMETVFSTKPKISMDAASDYTKSSDVGQTAAVFSTTNVLANDILRLDVTSIPAGLNRFNVFLIGNKS